MSIPPQIIRIKRKRTEDAPEALYFETDPEHRDGSKRPLTEYAFKLLREEDPTHQNSKRIQDKPKIHESRDTDKVSVSQSDAFTEPTGPESGISGHQVSETVSLQTKSKVPTLEENNRNRNPRRFHLSRPSRISDPEKILHGHQRHHKVLKTSRLNTPVFAERHTSASPAKRKFHQRETPHIQDAQTRSTLHDSGELNGDVSRRKTPVTRDGREHSQPLSREDPAGPAIDPSVLKIFAEMQKEYEGGLEDHSARTDERNASRTRVKPKNPAKRFHERHLEIEQPPTTDETMDIDGSEENDYVYDTYIRHRTDLPLSQVVGTTLGNGTFGFLIIDEEDQSLWKEFGDDGEDSEKDWNSEDEDENAEDYYGADYPEEEVDIDDEYDTGAYNYRYNASDNEEYDSETGAWSDDDDLRYPWKNNARLKRTNGDDDSDE